MLDRQFIERYHYLGCRVPVGDHLVTSSIPLKVKFSPVFCGPVRLGKWPLATAAIGWIPDQPARNLQFIVNNSRFLILPWVEVKALASTILARSARQVPHDWCQHYGYTPLLLETLVDVTRFNGTCYGAANWIALGETSGKGRMDRHHKARGTLKRVFVLPLHRRVQQRLCATDPPNVSLTNAD